MHAYKGPSFIQRCIRTNVYWNAYISILKWGYSKNDLAHYQLDNAESLLLMLMASKRGI